MHCQWGLHFPGYRLKPQGLGDALCLVRIHCAFLVCTYLILPVFLRLPAIVMSRPLFRQTSWLTRDSPWPLLPGSTVSHCPGYSCHPALHSYSHPYPCGIQLLLPCLSHSSFSMNNSNSAEVLYICQSINTFYTLSFKIFIVYILPLVTYLFVSCPLFNLKFLETNLIHIISFHHQI